MSTIRLRLPESLHRQARELAEQEGISINQLIATSLAEKLSVLMTSDYLEARAKRGSVRAFQRVLKKVKDRTPVAGDERQVRAPPSNKAVDSRWRRCATLRPNKRLQQSAELCFYPGRGRMRRSAANSVATNTHDMPPPPNSRSIV